MVLYFFQKRLTLGSVYNKIYNMFLSPTYSFTHYLLGFIFNKKLYSLFVIDFYNNLIFCNQAKE